MDKRTLSQVEFNIRDDSQDEKIIEGYFSVFNSEYHISDGAVETVERGAFANTLNDDIRALINHNTEMVLGRTKANTLELLEDEHGLFGRIHINPKDTDAMNIYERVKRGDVSQCSFGFDILDEETELREDGSVHFIIKAVKLYEVSVVTFPRYERTEVIARSRQADEIRKAQEWKIRTLAKLKGEVNGN